MSPVELTNLPLTAVINIFEKWGMSVMTTPNVQTSREATVSLTTKPFSHQNELYRCRTAHETDDGMFLVLENDTWQFGQKKPFGILIRQAYREHWTLIEEHFQSSTTRLFISGSPGTGKSVEGLYILHNIFAITPPPPILYANSANKSTVLVHYRGIDFEGSDYNAFMTSFAYGIMKCTGKVWHVFDSAAPCAGAGRELAGPQIVITSPSRAQQNDLKPLDKSNSPMYYLPLPSLEEMQIIRTSFYDDACDERFYISNDEMMDVINRFGCIPRTVFEFGKNKTKLHQFETKLRTASKIEDLLRQVGQPAVDHNVASGTFVHIVPYQRKSYESRAEEPVTVGSATTMPGSPAKRAAGDASLDLAGVTQTEYVELLKRQYTDIVYMWASDYIRDAAFEQFLFLTADRMLEVILSNTHSSFAGFRGLLLEPFVHKLLTETGVVGRMKNLESGQHFGNVRLGPWKTRNVYMSHSDIDFINRGVYNVPHKGNEAAVDSLVPYDGKCFQVTVSEEHGINRPGFEALINTGAFDDFLKRNPGKKIQFIWMIEASQFDSFSKQNFHGKRKKAYAANSSLRASYPAVEQFAFEIDLKRIYKFHTGQRRNKPVDMTDSRTQVVIDRAIKAAGLSVKRN